MVGASASAVVDVYRKSTLLERGTDGRTCQHHRFVFTVIAILFVSSYTCNLGVFFYHSYRCRYVQLFLGWGVGWGVIYEQESSLVYCSLVYFPGVNEQLLCKEVNEINAGVLVTAYNS